MTPIIFPGIATGLVILNEQHIPVEYYFSSEIDEHCRTVQRSRHAEKLVSLGDVVALAGNEAVLTALLPINIVFASPPCSGTILHSPLDAALLYCNA